MCAAANRNVEDRLVQNRAPGGKNQNGHRGLKSFPTSAPACAGDDPGGTNLANRLLGMARRMASERRRGISGFGVAWTS
jgi:hypothetical protein